MCSSRGLCEVANINCSDGSLWCRSANQTEQLYVTMVLLGREMRNVVLEVALVAATNSTPLNLPVFEILRSYYSLCVCVFVRWQ
jgi:hypothetical protein